SKLVYTTTACNFYRTHHTKPPPGAALEDYILKQECRKQPVQEKSTKRLAQTMLPPSPLLFPCPPFWGANQKKKIKTHPFKKKKENWPPHITPLFSRCRIVHSMLASHAVWGISQRSRETIQWSK